MSKLNVSFLKKGAVVNVPLSTGEIANLHSLLLKHLDDQISLDDISWDIITNLCHKIDACAEQQNLTEPKEVNF